MNYNDQTHIFSKTEYIFNTKIEDFILIVWLRNRYHIGPS